MQLNFTRKRTENRNHKTQKTNTQSQLSMPNEQWKYTNHQNRGRGEADTMISTPLPLKFQSTDPRMKKNIQNQYNTNRKVTNNIE